MTATLFDVETVKVKWLGSLAIKRFVGQRSCSRCSSGFVVESPRWTQEPLLRHGGYGAAERFSPEVCLACGGTALRMVETVRPMS